MNQPSLNIAEIRVTLDLSNVTADAVLILRRFLKGARLATALHRLADTAKHVVAADQVLQRPGRGSRRRLSKAKKRAKKTTPRKVSEKKSFYKGLDDEV